MTIEPVRHPLDWKDAEREAAVIVSMFPVAVASGLSQTDIATIAARLRSISEQAFEAGIDAIDQD